MKSLSAKKRLIAIVSLVTIILLVAIPVALAFGDVPPGHWAYNGIQRIYHLNITSGCGGGNYCPDDFVTRAQMAAFMHRLSDNQVVDAATAIEAATALEADHAVAADDAMEVNGGTAWMWAHRASPTIGDDIAADANYAYNSEGAAITYERTGVGQYAVTFPGWGTIGHSTVTAYRAAGIHCQNHGWGSGVVGVRCYNSAGAAADARFTVLLFGN